MSAHGLYIKSTNGKGRGVYCDHRILEDEIIEECPILIILGNEHELFDTTKLADYFFSFDKTQNTKALPLGSGAIYNHKRFPNAGYWINMEARSMIFYALENIDKHTEICVNYGGTPGMDYEIWFTARNIVYHDG
jgi:hypothetical protein